MPHREQILQTELSRLSLTTKFKAIETLLLDDEIEFQDSNFSKKMCSVFSRQFTLTQGYASVHKLFRKLRWARDYLKFIYTIVNSHVETQPYFLF